MRVTIDLMKKSTQIIDLSNVINPRVGDDDLQLPLHIGYGDNLFDMRGKDVEFLSNDPNKKNIYIAGTCNTNTPGDNLYMGDLTFRFPAGTFQADGTYDPDKTMFRIVDKETQKVISSVNVKITVMKNAIEFNFDPDKSSYNSRLENMLHDFHDKGQAMLDEIKGLNNQAKSNVSGDTAETAKQAKQQANQNAGDISDLKGEVAGARGRFADLPGRENAQDTAISQKETIVNANSNYAALQQKDAQQDAEIASKAGKFELEEKLSQMHVEPEAFKNLDDLKAKYPNGNSNLNVTVDNGHLFIWLNNAWNDCGQFQTAGIDQALVDQIKEISEQLNVLPELIDGQPTPNGGDTVISTTKYLDQDWLEITSTANTQYRGVNFWIDDPDKISEMENYPVKINFNIQSSIDQTLALDIHFYDGNDQDITNNHINFDNIALNAHEILNYQKEISLNSANLKGASKVALLITTLGTNDLGTILINNCSAVLEYKNVNILPQSFDGKPTPNTVDTVISTTKYLDQDWLKITSTANTQYRGVNFWIDDLDKISEMANYPVKINFNIQSSIDQTLALDIHFYDGNDQDITNNHINLDNITLNAYEILNYQKEISLNSANLKGASKVALLITTLGTNDLGTILINNYSTVLEYKNLNMLSESFDGQPSPNTVDTVISTTKYLDQDWLKITSTANTQYRGVNFWIDDLDKISEMANYPVKINFNIQSSIDQTLALDIHFYDGNGQDITNNHVNFDNITLNAYEILNYQKEISLNPANLKGASKVALLIATLGTNDLGTILINNYGAVLEYKQMPAEMSGTNDSDKLEGYYNLPIIKINGELAGMNKDNAKRVTYEYRNGNTVLTGSAKLKWQGNSSTAWNKKGYRLQPFTDNTFTKKEKVQFIPSWSPTSKINLKAYYTDGLLSRDVVNANIGADIASTNFSLPNDLKQEDNFGFIDGFPIVLIFNNEFEGIYSFNTARSDFDYVKYGIMGNGYTNVTYFTSTNKTDVKLDGSDFESLNPETVTDDEKSAVGDLVTWVATSSDENFKADFEKHLDLKTTVDYFILCNLLASTDSFVKNQIFLSWNGVKWFMQAYDLDCTLGISWEGKEQGLPTELIGTKNNLFKRLYKLFSAEISARYAELRTWLTPAYVLDKYRKRINTIGVGNYKLEFAKWQNPSKDIATYNQLKNAVIHQFELLDQLWLKK